MVTGISFSAGQRVGVSPRPRSGEHAASVLAIMVLCAFVCAL